MALLRQRRDSSLGTTPTERDVRNRRGVLDWNFEVAPGEAWEIKIAWRVRWPADKAVIFTARQ
jgi:hypothetical protein